MSPQPFKILFLTDLNPEQWGAALDFRNPEPSLLENKLPLQLLRIPEFQKCSWDGNLWIFTSNNLFNPLNSINCFIFVYCSNITGCLTCRARWECRAPLHTGLCSRMCKMLSTNILIWWIFLFLLAMTLQLVLFHPSYSSPNTCLPSCSRLSPRFWCWSCSRSRGSVTWP